MTGRQKEVLARVLELADTFFANEHLGSIRPRLFPLLGGATGAGKTFLIRKAAAVLKAEFVSITVGDWIPQGAGADYEPTAYTILAKVATNDRVVVCIDEVDKVRLDSDSTWGRSVASDLWRALDHNLPIAAFLRSARSTLHGVEISEKKLTDKIPSTLWFAGVGTWQVHYEHKSVMGFSSKALMPEKLQSGLIQKTNTIPSELLLRFHPEVIELSHPASGETEELFRATGLAAAAASVGLSLDPLRHDWRGGMRSIEAIWAEVAIRRRKQRARILNE